MGKFYIINSPWGFSTVWSLIKGWLDEVTVAKIHILGSNYKTELIAQIPEENLPIEFGGTCKCEGGCMLADQGPWQNPEIIKKAKELREAKQAATVQSKEKPSAVEPIPAPAPVEKTATQTDTAPAT